MVRFRVRPKREQVVVPCTAQLSQLLACFATTGDMQHKADCAVAAKALHSCMQSRGKAGRGKKSEINALLSKIK